MAAAKAFKAYIEKNRTTPIETPRSYGESVVEKARTWGKYHVFEAEKEAEAVLDTEAAAAVAACRTEHHLVARITRHLEDVFEGLDIHVVNSEEYKWLICDEAIYKQLPLWKSREQLADRRANDKYGKLTDWVLRDCIVATAEAKISINNQGIGEVMNYGNHIVHGEKGPPNAKLILFDKTKFLLFDVSQGENAIITECLWTTPGSKDLLRQFPFHEPPWVKIQKAACARWGLQIARDPKGSVWLGYGGFARVFRVKGNNPDKDMTLKVVLENYIAVLSLEMATMLDLARRCDFVMPIAKDCMKHSNNKFEDVCDFGDLGGAMLLAHVGDPVTATQYKEAIQLLAALH